MAATDERERREDIACPFCGVICDDLVVETHDGAIKVSANGCPRATAGFERPAGEAQPTIGGKPATFEHAVKRAAEILSVSRLPLFAGLGTDVEGMRAVMNLAERSGGVVDHMGSAGLFRNLRVLQDQGWIATTLSEVRNRVDLLAIVGGGVAEQFPRFFERCIWPADTLFGGDVGKRQVVCLGGDGGAIPVPPGSPEPLVIPCSPERLPDAVAALRALINGRPVAADKELPLEALDDLATRMKAATYGVVTWAAAAIEDPGADLVVASIAGLVSDLNLKTRFACLPLTGHDNSAGVNQVCTWQSGFPLRTGFARGYPEHDAHGFSASRLIESGEVDALVWISSFRPDVPPFTTPPPTVALTMPGTEFARGPEVCIPVGTPGLDHAGHVFRTDGVVALPVRKLRETGLPGVAEVVAGITAAMPAETEDSGDAG